MSEMVERVARAIARDVQDPDRNWPLFVDDARAAIAAMREPTEGMKTVCMGPAGEVVRDKWYRMIEEALR